MTIETAVLRVMSCRLTIVDRNSGKIILSDGSRWNLSSFMVRMNCFKEAINMATNKDPDYMEAKKVIKQIKILRHVENIKTTRLSQLMSRG